MKGIRLLLIILSITLLISACSSEKGISIKNRMLTEDEEMLIMNADGSTVEHFEIVGGIPKGYYLNFVVEEYKNGEHIHDRASTLLENEFLDSRGMQI